MNYYKHHIGDYRRDTAHLSLLEHGVYRQLLDLYYLQESAIPAETDWVIRRLSARTNEEISAVFSVLSDFFVLTENGYVHDRCDRELAEYIDKKETAKVNGKLGGRPKKTKSVIDGLSIETENKPDSKLTINHKPLTNNHKPIKEKMACPDKPESVDQENWDCWLKVRQAKKAPLTTLALKAVEREAGKAGLSINEAIRIAAERNWVSFNSDWISSAGQSNQSGSYESPYQRSMRERAQELSPGVARKAPGSVVKTFENFIDEVRNVAAIECH